MCHVGPRGGGEEGEHQAGEEAARSKGPAGPQPLLVCPRERPGEQGSRSGWETEYLGLGVVTSCRVPSAGC